MQGTGPTHGDAGVDPMIQFILANFVMLLVACAIAFVVGIVMFIGGNGMKGRGERKFRKIVGEWTEEERQDYFAEHGRPDFY